MTPNITIEERLTALERQMEEIKQQLAHERTQGNWIDKVAGSHKDDPVFAEIVRLGREFRRSQPFPEDMDVDE
jgi:hypothetical protein